MTCQRSIKQFIIDMGLLKMEEIMVQKFTVNIPFRISSLDSVGTVFSLYFSFNFLSLYGGILGYV